MLCDAPLDGLATALARRSWITAPSVRLFYNADDDSLVAEIVEMSPAFEVVAHDRLLVEFDGTDANAMPTRLTVTGVQTAPHSAAIIAARSVLGDELWTASVQLLRSKSARIDVPLDETAAELLRASWYGLAARLQRLGMIGVELIPGLVSAVLTDADATVQDSVARQIDDNNEERVASAIAELINDLARRNPAATAGGVPVAVQLGGPVDHRTGHVLFYDKPLSEGDEPWKNVALRKLVQERTDRPVMIYNDAQALANYEARFGLGRELGTVAVLVVRRGVGAKLVVNGAVADFPMEIGIFVSGSSPESHPISTERGRSIESRSGTGAIIKQVSELVGEPLDSVEAAAALAEHLPAALDAFWQAGAELAAGMAAIQAIANPDAWAIYGPDVLVDSATASGQAFFRGLGTMRHHLDWGGLRPGTFHTRSTTGGLGARAAAVAALGVSR